MLYPSAAAESASTTPEAQRLISVIAGTPGEEDDVDTWLISGREWKIKINNQISVCGGDGLVWGGGVLNTWVLR